ncbi:MAG TPA: hypothetical protein VF628_13145 [Allosphingosinicella sp.]|jgi:hypothetical protein
MRQIIRDLPLDILLEERDSIKIRINLSENGDDGGSGSLAAMKQDLSRIEAEIAEHRKGARG